MRKQTEPPLDIRKHGFWFAIAVAIGAALLFVGITQIVLVFPFEPANAYGKLKPAETISLISGAVTASGLAALVFQAFLVRADFADKQSEQRRQLALLAYRLQSEYNTPDMRAPQPNLPKLNQQVSRPHGRLLCIR